MPNLADRYQLAEIIYSDAHVVAYCAHDELLNRTVTIELLQAGRADEPQRAARLIAKARQAALTNLPHVAALYDQHTIEGRPFLVLEEPIGQALAQAAPLPAAQIVDVVQQVADTLRATLARQQAQPTINPTTVRIGPDGRVQIIDLGLDQAAPSQMLATQRLGHLIGDALGGLNDRQSAPLRRVAEEARAGAYPTIDALLAALHDVEQHADMPTTIIPRAMPTIDVRAAGLEPDTLVVAPEPRGQSKRWRVWAALGAGVLALVLAAMLLWPDGQTTQQPTPSAASSAAANASTDPASSPANGTLFVVTTNNGQSLVVRSGPGRNFSRITSIANGATVEVLGEPQSADGFNWVRIRTANVEGWCVSEALRRR